MTTAGPDSGHVGEPDRGQDPPTALTALPALIAFQIEVARLFFTLPAGDRFLLAGGAALLAQHLTDRPTQDLDLFTSNSLSVATARDELEHAAPTGRRRECYTSGPDGDAQPRWSNQSRRWRLSKCSKRRPRWHGLGPIGQAEIAALADRAVQHHIKEQLSLG